MATAKRIRAYEPATITIDAGTTIAIRVKRLDVGEYATFDRLFWRAVRSEADRLVTVRRPGEEQERKANSAISAAALDEAHARFSVLDARPLDGTAAADLKAFAQGLLRSLVATDEFKVPDAEIRHRRLCEMDAHARQRYDALRDEDAEAYGRFLNDALARFVKVDPDQLVFEEESGAETPVLNGAQLARCYGARNNVLNQIVLAIKRENELSDDQKNGLGSRSDSRPSSDVRDQKAIGESSAPTAGPVDPSGSATTAAVMPIAERSSGPTVN